MPPCCGRRQGKLTEDQNNLRSLAKKAAYHAGKGHDITKFKQLIVDMKATIELDKQFIADHEAEHANDTRV